MNKKNKRKNAERPRIGYITNKEKKALEFWLRKELEYKKQPSN